MADLKDNGGSGRRAARNGEEGLSPLWSQFHAMLAFTAALVLALAFLSFHPNDPVRFPLIFQESLKPAPENLLGYLGATLCKFFFEFFGLPVFLLLFPLVDYGMARLRVQRVNRPLTKGIGLALLVIGLALVLHFLPALHVTDGGRPAQVVLGGALGDLGDGLLGAVLGRVGVFLLGMILATGGFILLTRVNLAVVAAKAGGVVAMWFRSLWTRLEKRRAEKQKEALREQVIQKHQERRAAEEDGPITVHKKRPKEKPKAEPQPELPLEDPRGRNAGYQLPPVSLIDKIVDESPVDEKGLVQKANELKVKLAEFNVDGSIEDIFPGPVVTTIEFKTAPGIKFSKVQGLSEDLAMALSAETIRIDRVPGRPTIGVEVPNDHRETIGLRELLETEEFAASLSRLTVVLGRGIHGAPVVADLAKMPHLLVAGTTGSGKSVGLNTLITSMLYKATPEEVKFILVDPKMVEMEPYKELPHLLTPVVTDPRKAANALRWAVAEMDNRLKLLAGSGVRDITHYNSYIEEENVRRRNLPPPDAGQEPLPNLAPLPYIVVIIDELADLMMVAGRDVEESIARLAQKARAVGIHLILATQRPSVDVITGLIKANMPSRISFRLLSGIDSRTILDQNGAEALLGRGDMLFLAPGTARLQRVHGPYLTVVETKRIVQYCARQAEARFNLEVLQDRPAAGDAAGGDPGAQDDLYDAALRLVVTTGQASTSNLQRKLGVGYARAGKLMDLLEANGVVGPGRGSKPREILLDPGSLDG